MITRIGNFVRALISGGLPLAKELTSIIEEEKKAEEVVETKPKKRGRPKKDINK